MHPSRALARIAQSQTKRSLSYRLFVAVSLCSLLFLSAAPLFNHVLAASVDSSASIGSASINQPVGIHLQVKPTDSLNDGIVDLEIYNALNNQVYQKFYEHQNIAAGQTMTYDASWTPAASGHYQVKLGLFSSNWSSAIFWNDNLSAVDVSNSTVSPAALSGVFSASISSGQIALNQAAAFDVSFKPSSDISDKIVDIEIQDLSGNKIYQQFFEHQNIAANQSQSYHINWIAGNSGSFNVSAGVFNANWNGVINWQNNLLSFTVGSSGQSLSTPAPAAPAGTVQTTASVGGGTYTTSGGKIYQNGQQITLDGVSWFGFEGGNHAIHGLWVRNWQDMIKQIKSTGFNAIRIPFSPQTLANMDVAGIDYSLNPDLQGLKSMDLMDKIVNELERQGIYFIFDHHTPDSVNITDLWYTGSYSESQWISDLNSLAGRYKNLSHFVGLELKNEPHGSATWGAGNSSTDWNKAAERAGSAVLSANPNILVLVEGVESNPVCSDNSVGHFWGGNMEPVNCTPLSLPSDKVVYTPHVYGPDVYNQPYFNDSSFPGNMPGIWNKQFGFLKDQGKAVAVTEWGGRDGTGTGNPKDAVWQSALVDYFTQKGICDSFYWSWNPNSADTGGVLQDDWTTVWPSKVDLLNRYHSQCR